MRLSITWILLHQLWLLLILSLFLAFDGILQLFIHYHRTEQLPKCLLKPFLTLLLIENLWKHEKSWQNVTKVWLKMLTTLHTMLNWHLTVKLPPVSRHFLANHRWVFRSRDLSRPITGRDSDQTTGTNPANIDACAVELTWTQCRSLPSLFTSLSLTMWLMVNLSRILHVTKDIILEKLTSLSPHSKSQLSPKS